MPLVGRKSCDKWFGIIIILIVGAMLLGYTVWVPSTKETANTLSKLLKLVRYLAYLMAISEIICKRLYPNKILLQFLLFMLITILSMIKSGDRTMFLIAIIFISAFMVSSTYLIKCVLTVQVCLFILIVSCSLLGITEDYFWVDGERIRHCLGFSYTSIGPTLFYYMFLQYLYLKRGKISFIEYAVFFAVSSWLFCMTKSRTVFILSIVTATFFLIYPHCFFKEWFMERYRLLFLAFPFVIAALSYYFGLCYNPTNKVWVAINSLVNNRLVLSQEGIHNFGIPLFGRKIEWVTYNAYTLVHGLNGIYNAIDCSYLNILFEYGLLFLLFVLLGYSVVLAKAFEKREYYLAWIILFILIHVMVEPYILKIGINPFILLSVTELKAKREKKVNRIVQKTA